MLRLALSTLRGRWPALAGAFAALALGAALIISAVQVLAATSDAVPAGPQRYREVPVIVTAPVALRRVVAGELEIEPNPRRGALSPTLAARVAALPGVRRAVIDRAVHVRTPAGEATVARPWSARFGSRLTSGRAPLAAGEIVAPRGSAERTLVTAAGVTRYRVVGTVADGLYFSDAEAARLQPRIDALAVWPRAAAAAVREVIGRRGSVLTGARRADAEPDPMRDAVAGAAVLLSLMAMTLGFVAVFVVASSFAFSVALRRRELGLLRTVGATPRQVRRLVLREAALVALAGGLAGAAASLVVAPLLGRWIVAKGLAPASLDVSPAPLSLPIGAGFMLVVALTGAWVAARRAARTRPAEALRDAAVDRGVMTLSRWLAGVPALGGAIALALTTTNAEAEAQLPLTFGAAALAILGLALLAPLLVPRLVALLAPRGTQAMLIRRHARAGVRRTAATAAPVLVAVGLAGSLSAMVNSISASDAAVTRARVAPDALAISADGDLSEADVAALNAVPGATVGATVEGDLRTGATAYRAIGVDAEAIPLMLRVRALDGSLADLHGRTVALGELAARALAKDAGDRLRVYLPDGRRARLKVAAVVADGFGSAGMYVPRAVLGGASVVYARGADSALRAVAGERGLRIAGGNATRPVADVTDSSNMNPLALLVILGVAVVYVAIALAATAAIGTVARSGELALLRLAGATRGDVVRLVALEALVTTLVGGLLGCAVTALVVSGLQRGLAGLEGPGAIALPWDLVAALIAGFAAIAVTASALAAQRSQRPAPHLLVGGAV